jgi:hypothetical protein
MTAGAQTKQSKMRFDVHLRRNVRDRLAEMSARMALWDRSAAASDDLMARLEAAIHPFDHATRAPGLVVGGVDGSGDFPALAYADSFVYASVAAGALYEADTVHGLREIACDMPALVEFTWLSTGSAQRSEALFASFERLAGRQVDEILSGSDYPALGGRMPDPGRLREGLIVPAAHDAGNVGVQLRTVAELSAALRLIEAAPPGAIVLTDGTMSLPFVHRRAQSLFFEHLRRFCCVRARARSICFAALSKSDGLPAGLRLDEAARRKLGVNEPEHWYMRIPDPARDGWSPWPEDGPRVPPPGAASFLLRLHRSTPVMRLDLDAVHWQREVERHGEDAAAARLLGALDYAAHDQRCFGYPYPVKAAHDRASLTEPERVVLRRHLVDAAVAAGMRRASFRDAARMTGHA